jgi:hypothetical protein
MSVLDVVNTEEKKEFRSSAFSAEDFAVIPLKTMSEACFDLLWIIINKYTSQVAINTKLYKPATKNYTNPQHQISSD